METMSLPNQQGQIGKTINGITSVTKPYIFSKNNTTSINKKSTLSKPNLNTIEKLKTDKAVPQADVTRLLNNLIKTQDKETFNDIANAVFKKEKEKHPSMSDDKVLKELVKRFKGKDSKEFIKQEYIEKIIPSGGEKIKTKKDAEKNPTIMPKKLRGREEFEEMISNSNNYNKTYVDSAKESAKNAVTGGTTGMTGMTKTGGVEETKLVPNKGGGTTLKPTGGKGKTQSGSTVSDFFDTTSNLYAKNKGLVDSVAKAFTPENMESGGWFTSLASLAIPEIEIINSLMKFTPAGATAKDYIALEKIKRGEPSGLSDSEEQMLAFKSIVNPDLMGKNWEKGISKVGEDIGDALSTTWGKITGHKLEDKKTELQVESAEAIAKRLATAKKADDKKKYVETLMADPNAKPKFEMPTGFGKTGGSSGAFNPKTGESIFKPVMTAEQALTPPDLGNYGWSDPTVMEDISRWFVGAFSPVKAPSNKEEYIAQMKTANPDLYARYEKEMGDYNWKLKKSTLTPETQVDASFDQNKKLIQSIQMTNDILIKKAKSLKQLTTEQAERAYDINESLTEIMEGRAYMTYDDIAKINSRLLEQYSPEVKKLALPDLIPLYEAMDAVTSDQFGGDSKLKLSPDIEATPTVKADTDMKDRTSTDGKYDEEVKDGEETKDEDGEPPEEEPKETGKNTLVSEKRIEVGMDDSFPRLRPQLEWGGTDKLLDRDSGEYKRAENYAELMSINPDGWYNGAGNRLYLANQKTDQMRYGRTYQLNYKPAPYDPNPAYYRQKLKSNKSLYSKPVQSTNKQFNELQRPIFTSQYAPMLGFEQARDQYDFQQFVRPTPKELQTVYPVVQRQQYHNYFPDTINEETGGVAQMAMMSPNEFIIQSRYRR